MIGFPSSREHQRFETPVEDADEWDWTIVHMRDSNPYGASFRPVPLWRAALSTTITCCEGGERLASI
jgi:hypothetical protein